MFIPPSTSVPSQGGVNAKVADVSPGTLHLKLLGHNDARLLLVRLEFFPEVVSVLDLVGMFGL